MKSVLETTEKLPNSSEKNEQNIIFGKETKRKKIREGKELMNKIEWQELK